MGERSRPKPGEGVPQDVRSREGKTLGALWKAHAQLTKRTQEQFAEEMGFSQGNFSHYVGGRRPIPLDIGMALAKEMGCTIADFSPRLAAELARKESERLAPWPFQSVAPERISSLSPGLRLQVEGALLEELDRIESRAKAPRKRVAK